MSTVVDPKAFAAAIRRRPSMVVNPMQNVTVERPAADVNSVSQAKLVDVMSQRNQAYAPIDGPVYGGGPGAAIAGLLQGIGKSGIRLQSDKDFEAALQHINETERAEAAAKAQAAQAVAAQKREADMADWMQKEQYKRDNPQPLSPKDQMAMDQTRIQIAELMQRLEMNEAKGERDQVKFEQEQKDAAKVDRAAEQERNTALQLVNELLGDEDSMASATGSIDGATWSILPGTVTWENKFNDLKNLTTLDNLDRMTGVLSESDLQMLKSAANVGLHLRSETSEVKKTLERMRDALGGTTDQVGGEIAEGATATNPQTGQRIIYQNGEWVPYE